MDTVSGENSETVISSIEAYLKIIHQKYNGLNWIFRGQADVKWSLTSSAERRIHGEKARRHITSSLRSSEMLEYLQELIDEAKSKFSKPPSDLKMLSALQHYGAATNLIDFTRKSKLALWMACSQEEDKDGKVFILDTSQKTIYSLNEDDEKKQIQEFVGRPDVLLWEPHMENPRMKVQKSIFLITNGNGSIETESIVISASCKKEILSYLILGEELSESNIYPDFYGFAVANSQNKYYDQNIYLMRAIQYGERKENEKAMENIEKAKMFDSGKLYIELALSRVTADCDLDKALEHCNEAIKLDLKNAIAYSNRASVYHKKKFYKKALKDFDTACNLNPYVVPIYNNRGLLYVDMEQYGKAWKDYNDAIEINPELSAAYYNRAQLHHRQKRYDAALDDFYKLIELAPNPKLAMAYNGRGNVYYELKRYEEALKDYDQAIELDPEYAMAYCNRAVFYFYQGEYGKALEDCESLLSLTPEDPGVVHLQKMIWEKMSQGKKD